MHQFKMLIRFPYTSEIVFVAGGSMDCIGCEHKTHIMDRIGLGQWVCGLGWIGSSKWTHVQLWFDYVASEHIAHGWWVNFNWSCDIDELRTKTTIDCCVACGFLCETNYSISIIRHLPYRLIISNDEICYELYVNISHVFQRVFWCTSIFFVINRYYAANATVYNCSVVDLRHTNDMPISIPHVNRILFWDNAIHSTETHLAICEQFSWLCCNILPRSTLHMVDEWLLTELVTV